jgi:hypothetical protein
VTWLARAAFVLLVGATFGSFFVAQRLKGAAPVVDVRGLHRFLSPNGDGRFDVSRFSVRLEHADRLTLDVVDAGENPVRRVIDEATIAPGHPFRAHWNGRTEDGARAADGSYRLRAQLHREGRSVLLPWVIRLDTTPPRPHVVAIRPGQLVGPHAPKMTIAVRGIRPRFRTHFQILRTDDGEPREVARFWARAGEREATWDGIAGGAPAPPGVYLVRTSARDRAGNVGATPSAFPPPPGEKLGRAGITVRGIAVQPPLRPVTAGTRAEFFVDSRRRPYAWQVRRVGRKRPLKQGRVPAGKARPLTFSAPSGDSGLYLLELRAGTETTRVPFAVQSAERANLLVVVPAITWLGSDHVDDGPRLDGVPNTLAGGGPVAWPRVFGGDHGIPAGFADQVAPLLVFLDRVGIRYDLTTDLDLTLSTGPRESDRKGVLLAGPLRWISRGLARRLRRYVQDGGSVASFGVDTLRRGVTVRAARQGTSGELWQPTQPTAEDALGTTLLPVRHPPGPAPLEPVAGSASNPLLTGFAGVLTGFGPFEPSRPPEPGSRQRLLVALGRLPAATAEEPAPEAVYALTATRIGKGTVIRVGLPQWSRRLHQPDVAQLTRNIADLLRGATPKLRSTR